jgi:catalase
MINSGIVDVKTYHADGAMNYEQKDITDAYYEPNSFDGPVEDKAFEEPALKIENAYAKRYDHREGNDDFSQPRALFNLMSENEKEQLFGNIARAMDGVPLEIINRQLELFAKIDEAYKMGVKKALGI